MSKFLFKSNLLLALILAVSLMITPGFALANDSSGTQAPNTKSGDGGTLQASQTKSLKPKSTGTSGISTNAIGSYGNISSELTGYLFLNDQGQGTSSTKLYDPTQVAYVEGTFQKNSVILNSSSQQHVYQAYYSSGKYHGAPANWEEFGYHEAYTSYGYFLASDSTYAAAYF